MGLNSAGLMTLSGGLLAGLMMASSVIAGEVYRCESESGDVTYSQFPCRDVEQQVAITVRRAETKQASGKAGDESKAAESSAADNPIITAAQLQGVWTDFPDEPAFASTWDFSLTHLVFDKYIGLRLKTRYTLEGNTLTLHHQPSAMRDEPYDEVLEIVRYTGDSLTWDAGILVTIHRVN